MSEPSTVEPGTLQVIGVCGFCSENVVVVHQGGSDHIAHLQPGSQDTEARWDAYAPCSLVGGTQCRYEQVSAQLAAARADVDRYAAGLHEAGRIAAEHVHRLTVERDALRADVDRLKIQIDELREARDRALMERAVIGVTRGW